MESDIDIINSLDAKKQEFLQKYIEAFGIVTVACKAAGISRAGYYLWIREDEAFKNAIENSNAKEAKKDFVEHALIKLVNSGDTSAVIFSAKTLLKDRGYIERTEIDHKGNVTLSFTDNLKDV